METTPQQKTDDFISTFSHDLKNPLTAAVGSIDIIREGCLGTINEEQEEYLQSAIDSCNEVVTMIDNVQDISRFEHGKMQLSLQPCSCKELISKVAERFVRSARHENIRFPVDVEPDVPDILVDKGAFMRVIGSLLGNALTVTPEGAAIAVTCGTVAGKTPDALGIPGHAALSPSFFEKSCFVRISVRDSGEGIPISELERIFDRTVTSTNISGRERNGAKLGLAYCKLAIIYFHGAIWAESGTEQGGEFIILLPSCSDSSSKSQ
ncbi:MAG: HAMP domain-containing sensor histidine kinase [Desulfuromonadaceae bacterium]|nr:HAMP domain-containing sensor histidine kinase [Desulfuromonadaceae bacterium]MDD5106359.1 HAMP domain-containing sensor histidine kinase [Desulfuromonadaceae bacterium]